MKSPVKLPHKLMKSHWNSLTNLWNHIEIVWQTYEIALKLSDKLMKSHYEMVPTKNETFHNRVWHYTHSSAGTCLFIIIKVVTTSWGTIKGINSQISLRCQVYSHCRSQLIELGTDDETMTQFRELKKEDIRASTAILTPNTPRSTSLQLSWIWHDVTQHILSAVDAELPTTDAATILECMSSSCSSHYSF